MKQRMRAAAETQPEAPGEAGTNYPGEILIPPEDLPDRVSVPGAPGIMQPVQAPDPEPAAEPAGHVRRGHRTRHRRAS